MTQGSPKVSRLPTSKQSSSGGNGVDGRLRDLEVLVARIDERVAALQKDVAENMAKKNDVTGLKVWILGGVLSGIIIAAVIAATVVKAFF